RAQGPAALLTTHHAPSTTHHAPRTEHHAPRTTPPRAHQPAATAGTVVHCSPSSPTPHPRARVRRQSMANRLAESLSPYLRLRADGAVDWCEWGPAACAESRRRDVAVFLSIGYAACHGCHVRAHESCSDPEVARVLNAGFVPVKV